jgi:hypothetical protein
MSPPEEFDDKGNIKKFTKEELAKLKGDDPAEKKLPGYKSDFAEIQVGDYIHAALSVWKKNAKAAPKKKAGKAKKDEDVDKEAKDDLDADAKNGKWVVAGKVMGKVTKIQEGNTDTGPTLTVQLTLQVPQVNGRNGGNTNQTIKPDQGQATLIVIGQRQATPQGGGKKGKGDKG